MARIVAIGVGRQHVNVGGHEDRQAGGRKAGEVVYVPRPRGDEGAGTMSTIKPIFLLADSQLLFWCDEGGLLLSALALSSSTPTRKSPSAMAERRGLPTWAPRTATLPSSTTSSWPPWSRSPSPIAARSLCLPAPDDLDFLATCRPHPSRRRQRREGLASLQGSQPRPEAGRALLRRRAPHRHLRRRRATRPQGLGRRRHQDARHAAHRALRRRRPRRAQLGPPPAGRPESRRARPRPRRPQRRRRHLPPRLLRRARAPGHRRGRPHRRRPPPGPPPARPATPSRSLLRHRRQAPDAASPGRCQS